MLHFDILRDMDQPATPHPAGMIEAAAEKAVEYLNYHNNPPDDRDRITVQLYVESLGQFFSAFQSARESTDPAPI